MIHVFTSAAGNYLPKVRLLCASIKQYHPEWVVHLALPDTLPRWLNIDEEPFDDVITIDELNIPDKTSWIFRHSLVELSTAIKPFVVLHLLQREECEGVLYFDPDMVLFSRLDDLVEEWWKGSVCLTPHQNKPEGSLEAIIDNEIGSLRYGVYNLGFVGVRSDRDGQAFGKWWAERLYHFCKEGLLQGLWTDQKWIDLAPALFDNIRILKSSRFNVAAWNITTREVSGSMQNGITVDDEPLGFYHFSGWDSGAHKIMAVKYAGDNEPVMDLINWYGAAAVDDPRCAAEKWGYAQFDNGEAITKTHRNIYRSRVDLQKAYPNPFHVEQDGQCYYNWYRWRAEIEHPEMFLEDSLNQSALLPYNANSEIDWSKLKSQIGAALKDYRHGISLYRKAASIIRTHGFKGLKSKISRR